MTRFDELRAAIAERLGDPGRSGRESHDWKHGCPDCGGPIILWQDSVSVSCGHRRCFGDQTGALLPDLVAEVPGVPESSAVIAGVLLEPQSSVLNPCSSRPKPSKAEPAPVDTLLARFDAGEIAGPLAELPPLPPDASGVARKVAAFYAKVLTVRRWGEVTDPDEVAFALSWVAEKTGEHRTSVHNALKRLVEWGVLVKVGAMPGRGGRRGTHLYAPGHLPAQPGVIEAAEHAGQVIEREPELVDDPLVTLAQVAAGDAAAGAAVGHAGGQVGGAHVGHVPEPKCSEGGHLSEDELIQALKDELHAVEIGGRT